MAFSSWETNNIREFFRKAGLDGKKNLTESIQDTLADCLKAGSGVSIVYDDVVGTLTISSSGGGGGGLSAEDVRDTIGATLVSTGLISIVVNDAADTITVSTTATANDTDANLKNRANHTGTQAAGTITGLASVAISGAYADLTGKLTIPTVPSAVSAFTNDSGYQTAANVTAITGPIATSVAGNTSSITANTTSIASLGTNKLDGSTYTTNRTTDLASIAAKAPLDTQSAITYAASLTLDMSLDPIQTLALTGNVAIVATSSRVIARQKAVIITADSSARTLSFPASWIFLGTAPTSLAASKTAVLSLYLKGTAETDVIASYAVQA